MYQLELAIVIRDWRVSNKPIVPNEITEELMNYYGEECASFHYIGTTFYIDWNNNENVPMFKEWLIETFGEQVKNYKMIAIDPS
jgi:hypothetical protein